jgi:hypothetical protein
MKARNWPWRAVNSAAMTVHSYHGDNHAEARPTVALSAIADDIYVPSLQRNDWRTRGLAA